MVNCSFSLFLFRFFIGDSLSSYSKAKAFLAVVVVVVVVVAFVVLVFFFFKRVLFSAGTFIISLLLLKQISLLLCAIYKQINVLMDGTIQYL